jgi:hypothetical protein
MMIALVALVCWVVIPVWGMAMLTDLLAPDPGLWYGWALVGVGVLSWVCTFVYPSSRKGTR